MELEEEEAQICRLCGQCESIYIDVFGEEGTKRFLGLKIHSKINILIDESDPLPKAICVQCLGKLEFVCDFQEECLRTQQVLRDRYNLPPLSDIAQVKNEETTPGTSTDNNNSIDKNLNSSVKENVKPVVEQRVSPKGSKSQRNLRSQQQQQTPQQQQQQGKDNVDVTKEKIGTEHKENAQNTQTIETSTPTRWLRSRHNADTTSTLSNTETLDCEDIPIANRLRSHGGHAENGEKQNAKQQDSPTIQIPTSALNKLLTIVSSSPNIEVSVKESRNRNSDAEDISFTVELCKRQSEDVTTVRARVFPEQGSCIVDTAIVNLLQNQSSIEVNGIINTIISNGMKGAGPGGGNSDNGESTCESSKEIIDLEAKFETSQNPEELFRIDGEEIRVDDNVEHVVAENNQNGYACKLCRKFYERRDKCTVHVKTHLGIKQYACVLCSAKFVCKSDVMKHIRCSHTNPRPIQCPKCPKRFKSKFYLTEHDNVHKGIRPYCCTDCGQSYHHKVSLQIHMKSHLPPQNLACEYCGKVFPYRTRLLSHIASVHLKNRRNFRCRFCYNLYSSLSVLNEHVKTRHATTYTCEVCTKTFKVASKYKAHVLQHSNPKPFVCNVCNNRYASKAFLNEHLLKHEGLRKHVCQKCGANFAQASHLAAHRHVHGEKTHACPECGRKFNRRDNMKVHRKRHFEGKKNGGSALDSSSAVTSNTTANGNVVVTNNTSSAITSATAKQKTVSDTTVVSSEKIKEGDGLPQSVCMRCLGTLEFLCDFYDRCHYTQKKLKLELTARDPVNILDIPKTIRPRRDSDVESDKENALPPSTKQKIKSPKSCLTVRENDKILPKYEKSEKKLRDDSLTCKTEREDKKSSMLPILSPFSNVPGLDERPARKKSLSKADILSLIDTFEENSDSVVTLSKDKKPLAYRRGRGRGKTRGYRRRIDSWLTSKSGNSYLGGVDRKRDKIFDETERERKRIPSMLDTEGKENTADSKKPDKESKPGEHNYVESVKIESHNNTNVIHVDSRSCVLRTSPTKGENKLSSTSDNEDKSTSMTLAESNTIVEIDSSISVDSMELKSITDNVNNKPIVLIVKSERSHNESIYRARQPALISASSTALLMQEPSKPKIREESLTNISPPPGDEAERIDSTASMQPSPNKDNTNNGDATVMESSSPQQGDITSTLDNDKSAEENELVIEDSPVTKGRSKDSNAEDRRRRSTKDSSFGKVSELISDEQKLAIETYYRVDMSMVDTETVLKNLTVIDRKSIRCDICNLVYPRMDKCQVHVWGHLNMKPYICTRCNFSTVTVSNVRCHIRKSHLKIKPFVCHSCGKRYVTAVLLEEHLNTHTGARPFKCKLCDFASASRQVLSYHKTTHKPAKDINCKICGKEFFSRARLRAHMLVHNKDKVVVCKLCSVYLSSNESLESHQRKVHACDYVCNICNKRLKSRKALHNHQNVHAAAKYKCSLCSNVYKSKHILKEHLLKHEGIRKYKCTVCEKSFAQQSHLAAHMAVHSEIRFHCPGCQRAFNRHDNMKVHARRCESFLANPELKEHLTRREKSKSNNQKNSPKSVTSKKVESSTSTMNPDEKAAIMAAMDSEDLTSENTVTACTIKQSRDLLIGEL